MTEKLMASPSSPAGEVSLEHEAEVFVMPCSISQQRFWLLEQLSPGNTALNIPLAVQLSGPLDVPVLERALNAIVMRHEILRTSFAQVEGVPKQVIKTEARLDLGVIDLAAVPLEKRQERIEREMIAEAARPLSLTQAPILRTTLLRLTPKENVLMLTIHHIVGDGWSNGLLVREVGLFYDAFSRNQTPQLPVLAYHYADYALWQQEWLKTPQFQEQLGYWKKTLDGDLPVLDFPTDFPRQMAQPYTAFIESLLLPPTLADGLKRLCVDLDVTLFMILFSAYVTLLHRYTGQTEFVVGTTAANRNRSEMENLIGLFANPLILRPTISSGMTFRELAVRLRDHSLDGFAHQEVPFEIILEQLQAGKGARKPSIQTHFLYQKAFMEPATYGDMVIRPLRSVSPGSTFELTYGIVERVEGIRLQMEFHTALYKNSTIRSLLHHFQSLLEAAVRNPDTPVSEMTLLTPDEAAALWPAQPAKEIAARPVVDVPEILKDLERQLDEPFRVGAESFGVMIEAPPGTRLVTLDRHLRLLPEGIPGKLYLGGVLPESDHGYALVSGPSDSSSPVPLYPTEFVSRNREDGKIELWGHERDFTRAGGFRVNLRQSRNCLLQHPDVAEALLLSQPSPESKIIGYVVPRAGTAPTEKELRAFLKGKISDFGLPARIVVIAALPKDDRGALATGQLPKIAPRPKPSEDEHVPLEGILYQQLIDIWQDILKVPSLSIDDNFFALGGSSLLALRMMVQIEKLCGRPLPLSLLLTGATIANLARYIVETNSESSPPLVAVQPRGNRPPLFFLHGDWAGGGYYCSRLAQELGGDQPFYAVPPYRSGRQEFLTLEEMASSHLAAIRKHTPQGPYILGGYCIGATVAMEIARQLTAKGEKVTHLFLIDPPLWGAHWLRWVWPAVDAHGDARKWDLQKKIHFYDQYCVSFSRWLKSPLKSKLNTLLRRLGWSQASRTDSSMEGRESGVGDEEILNSMDYAVYFLAYRLYKVKPLLVPATLYFPESTRASRIAWAARASEKAPVPYVVTTLPGNHNTCVTKHTSALAEKMRKTLDSL